MTVRACWFAFLAFIAGTLLLGLPVFAWAGPPPAASPTVYTFEQFSDSDALTTQYAGLTFSNAEILTAGVSLNDLEAPPHSGVNVVSDNGGPITIDFASPIVGFGGYFNYAVPLTLTAFDAGGQQIGSATSLFSSDFALSGDPGSTPNEFIQILDSASFSKITITGDPAGDSFTLDDATVTSSAAVPEASTVASTGLLLLLGLGGVAVSRKLARSSRP